MKHTDCNDCNIDNKEIEKELESLKSDLDKTKKELEDSKKKALYIMADLENTKRNSFKEVEIQTTRNTIKVIKEFLNVLDDFERCLQSEKEHGNVNLEGLQMIHKTFVSSLEKLLIIEVSTSCIFDPSIHEAISFIEQKDSDKKHNEIHSVVKKGYKYRENLIRPAQVIVVKEEEV